MVWDDNQMDLKFFLFILFVDALWVSFYPLFDVIRSKDLARRKSVICKPLPPPMREDLLDDTASQQLGVCC